MANQVTTLKMGQKYKRTALGEIPVDWKIETLSSVAKIIMGQAPDSSSCNLLGNGLPFYQGNADFGKTHPTPRSWCSDPKKRAADGDILISVRAPVGAINIAQHACCIGRGLSAVRATDINAQYLYYGLNLLSPILAQLSQGSTFKAINSKDLANLPVAVPTTNEQEKIGRILSAVDAAIEKTNAVLEKIGEFQGALLRRFFPHGIGQGKSQNVPVGRGYGKWKFVPLEKIAEIERGKFQNRPRSDPRFYGGRYPFIQTGDVTNSGGRIKEYRQALNEEGLAISKLFPKGTILITIAANIGETAIAEFDVAFPDSLIGIVAGKDIDNRFLEYYLRTRKHHLNALATQSAQKNINLQTLRPYPVPVPPKDEQTAIVNILDAVGQEELSEVSFLNKLRGLKSALMYELLTGKVRI